MQTQKSISSLFEDITNNKIVLPDFQREFVWDLEKQKRLLASILVHLSIGSLLLIEGKKKEYLSKEVGYTISQNNSDSNDDCQFLLDGQQRLTSIWSFFSDVFDPRNEDNNRSTKWQDAWDKLYDDLRYRWFVSIKPQGDSDFFGYNNLFFNLDEILKKEPAEILPHIFYKKINKTTKFDEWYHPEFFAEMKRLYKNKKEAFLKKFNVSEEDCLDEEDLDSVIEEYYYNKAAEQGLVPLHMISNPDQGLYKSVIICVANAQLANLKTEVETCKNLTELKEKIIKLFEKEKTVTNIAKECKKWKSLDDLQNSTFESDLSRLATTWQTYVLQYFQDKILNTEISQIVLKKDQIQRAIAIFTAINEGGQKLSTFDLVVAKAAKEYKEKSLLMEIKSKIEEVVEIPNSICGDPSKSGWSLNNMGCIYKEHIETNFQDSLLNILSALVHTEYKSDSVNFSNKLTIEHFKTAKQLEMTPEQIAQNFELAMTALQRAHAFLQFRCGIVQGKDLQYRLMLLPIAFCLLDNNCWKDASKINKLECWYWSSIFSGVYMNNQNDKACKDVKYMYSWLVLNQETNNEITPLTKRIEDIFTRDEYTSEETLCLENEYTPVPTAVRNCILQYFLSRKPYDFLPSNYEQIQLKAWELAKAANVDGFEIKVKYTDEEGKEKYKLIKRVEDHHICPLKGATKLGQSSKSIRKNPKSPWNSPMNRTYISDLANGLISDMSTDQYFDQINKTNLSNHCVPNFRNYYNYEDYAGKTENEIIKIILHDRFSKLKEQMTSVLNTLSM